MAHTHTDVHEVDVIDRGSGGIGAGLMLAIATLLVIAVIGLAVLWTRPWDGNGSTNNNNTNPGISDNSGGGNGGSTGGGAGDNSGGGQPAQ